MRIAYKQGEKVPKPKLPTRQQQVKEMAEMLIAKWTARDTADALKKYGLTRLPVKL